MIEERKALVLRREWYLGREGKGYRRSLATAMLLKLVR